MTVTTDGELERAALRLESVAPGYLERVRRATGRLAARPGVLSDPRVALEALSDVATIDAEAPTASQRRASHLVKEGVRRLVGWYLRYLGSQVTVLGQATVRLGSALVERTEDLGDETTRLRRDLAALAERVETLERGGQ